MRGFNPTNDDFFHVVLLILLDKVERTRSIYRQIVIFNINTFSKDAGVSVEGGGAASSDVCTINTAVECCMWAAFSSFFFFFSVGS